jgi:hypothetical protein
VAKAHITYDLPDGDAVARKPTQAEASRVAGRLGLWSGLLASTAGLSAYLALLGGALLALRFAHAGLPVAQAVGEVPLSTLITTALVELLLPALGLTIAFVVSLPNGWPNPERTIRRPRMDLALKVTGTAILACIVPANLYGAALALAVATVFFSDRWTAEVARRLGITERVALVAVILVMAALPVLARQVIEPLNMERVEVERQGQPALTADLVAVRDNSIAIARCHHLFVLPMPTSIRIERLPSNLGVGTSIVEKIGIFSPHPVKPQPMPC